jgi:hypothetical protein
MKYKYYLRDTKSPRNLKKTSDIILVVGTATVHKMQNITVST